MHRKSLLDRLRGGRTLARALVLALLLQIAAPLLGLVPGVAASTPARDSITVCTAHGIVTLVPDGQGGWAEKSEPSEAGLSCSFCLPLLSGHAGPVSLALPMPLPAETERPAPVLALAVPAPAVQPGSSSPRAPPVL